MTPDSLVTNNSSSQTVAANTPVVFTDNIASTGTSITHTEGDAEISLSEQGVYLLYYDGNISGPVGAAYPLTVTVAAYQDGAQVSGSSVSVTLTAAGVNTPVNGYAFIRVGTATVLPSEIVVQADADNITWSYVEAVIGKSV